MVMIEVMNTKNVKSNRKDGRKSDEIRKISITRDYLQYPAGSALIEMGETKVICTATVEDFVPNHRKGIGGWVTAEYSMLPGSTSQRGSRERGGPRGRTQEIQRLIGRALRAVTDMDKLGDRTVILDADVIQADGGTRTAAITGCFVALHDALTSLKKEGKIKSHPVKQFLAAVSVGVVGDDVMLDLPYDEDVSARVDMNVVMTESGRLVEVQGTAEASPFSRKQLDQMLDMAAKGIRELIAKQKEVLKD